MRGQPILRNMPTARGMCWAEVTRSHTSFGPGDYQTADIEIFADWPDVAANLAGIGVVLKEWVGLVAYYAMDRTDELFPGPVDSSDGG